MPKLFLPNAENVIPTSEGGFSEFFQHKTLKVFPRFLCSLNPGDVLVTPTQIEPSFQSYICSLLDLGAPEQTVINVKMAASCLLTDAIKADAAALQAIKERCQGEDWFVEPYIQTEPIFELGQQLELPVKGTAQKYLALGLIDNLNSKDFCKALAIGAGCQVPPGMCADSGSTLEQLIDTVSAQLSAQNEQKQPKLMLRKIQSAGGAGNLAGTADELKTALPQWYGGSRVLVEQFIDFETVCGSLSFIDDQGCHFIGLDSQVFDTHGGWCGFDYPANLTGSEADEAMSKLLADINRLGRSVYLTGARGYLNMDWGLTRNEHGQLEPIFLECNFRHNGFGYVVDIAKHFFGPHWSSLYISSRESLPTAATTTDEVLDKLGSLTYEGEPLLLHKTKGRRGLVITSPPAHGTVALAALGESEEYVESALALAARALKELH